MFGRLVNVVRGFFSLFIKGIEKRNPEALLELEQENLRKQIANYNQSLAAHAGLVERLISQVRKLEKDEAELRASTTAHLRAGNQQAAAQYALRLQTVTRELAQVRLVLVGGLPGVGKSTLAAELADRLDATVLSSDPMRRELAENRNQMASAEETYQNLVKARDVAVQAARAKIESLKGAINDMRMKSAVAEMNEMAAGMIGSIGGSGDTHRHNGV